MTLAATLDRIDADLDAAVARLCDLLAIPSVSTDPAHAADCDRAADWLVADLAALGFRAEKRATPGHPMVVAHAGAEAAGCRICCSTVITTCSRSTRWSFGTMRPSRP